MQEAQGGSLLPSGRGQALSAYTGTGRAWFKAKMGIMVVYWVTGRAAGLEATMMERQVAKEV